MKTTNSDTLEDILDNFENDLRAFHNGSWNYSNNSPLSHALTALTEREERIKREAKKGAADKAVRNFCVLINAKVNNLYNKRDIAMPWEDVVREMVYKKLTKQPQGKK